MITSQRRWGHIFGRKLKRTVENRWLKTSSFHFSRKKPTRSSLSKLTLKWTERPLTIILCGPGVVIYRRKIIITLRCRMSHFRCDLWAKIRAPLQIYLWETKSKPWLSCATRARPYLRYGSITQYSRASNLHHIRTMPQTIALVSCTGFSKSCRFWSQLRSSLLKDLMASLLSQPRAHKFCQTHRTFWPNSVTPTEKCKHPMQ